MESRIRGVRITYTEHGAGVPLVALHGAGVDHREIEAALEAVLPPSGYRRIYPDLPGMGRSTADGLTSNNDVVHVLSDFVDEVSADPVLIIGHSYGAYLARGLAAMRSEKIRGLALICPVGASTTAPPPHRVAREDDNAFDELDVEQRAGFADYFIVHTHATARRYRDAVAPGTTLVDEPALERISSAWDVDVDGVRFRGATVIVAGRGDSTAGYADAARLMDAYPNATFAAIHGAGHALMHEAPDLLGALLHEWLARA
ncbi:pimeloyl-ACP methyl ester carboxylesterase [Okibacterium sp. HSC-33S16]|uniref:alpha/beta fold hydrolase n=1 Tax=Okibacterium sp. HSC-33S16 TaxID=2910965 RepID=UPI0020A22B69|nr:alpha/beta hydrolase [Okibacterium sp. HSC-33S16]MCP2031781.1 pimeloyl-ACP methyl ester carboxylesterase [Okibacterium sp. HSC-33S16]